MDLQKVISAAQLPALPQSAIRLLELSHDPNNGPVEFARPLDADPGLTSQVLRLVNSSYFGFSQEISSVKLAINMVGIRTIKNFALWSAVFSLLPNPKCGPLNLKGLWQDSLQRALFARAVAKLLGGGEPEDVFTASLLQDMAIPLLAKESPIVYAKLLDARKEGTVRLSVLEERLFGWNHGQAAGMMARQWNLPAEFAGMVEDHMAVERWAADPGKDPGRFATALSALLPSGADPSWPECGILEEYYEKILRPGYPTLAGLLERIDIEFAQFAPVLRLSTPTRTLCESLRGVAAMA